MEKIIALRIRLDGSKESTSQVKTLTTEIQQIGKQIDALLVKGNQLKKLQDQLGKGKPISGGTGTGSGGGTGGRAPSAPRQGQSTDLNSAASLRRQIADAKAANVSVDALIQRVGKLKAEQTEANREIRAAARAFEETKAAAGSYREINAQLVKARDNYRQLGVEERNSIGGKESLARIRTLDRELKDLDADMGIYARNVGNYSSAFSQIGGVALRAFSVIGVALSADQVVEDAARISDSISNVQKVSGLATEQARKLADQLALRDTRTSLSDQLDIAETGGRIGINADNLGIEEAQRQLVDFTDAIDTANVALGDQFDNDAQKVASTLAGLRNVLTDFRPNGDGDIGGDLLRLGNALNFLETQGNSTAPVIADFVNRIGGTAVPLGASTESIFALSTTLDELEVSAERGATAVSNTLAKIAAAPEKFGREVVDSGLIESTGAFTELVNNDIISALSLVATAVQKNSTTNTEFAQGLNDLGITGARAQEVFGKLGGANERYNELLVKSQKSLSETTSLTEEFNTKNNNLAADLAKLRNSITNAFASSEVQDALRLIIQSVSQFVSVLISVPRFIIDNRMALLLLAAAYVTFNSVAIAAQLNTLRLAAAQKASVVASRAAAIGQRLLNVAMNANPIGLVVSAVFLLVGAFTLLYKNSETVRNGINAFGQSITKAYEQSGLLKTVLTPLVSVFRLIYDLITGNSNAVERFTDSAKTFASNVPAFIEIVNLKFKQLALTIAEAFTFGSASEKLKASIESVKTEIEAQQRIITNNNKGLAEREILRRKEALKADAEASKEKIGVLKGTNDEIVKEDEAAVERRKRIAQAARDAAKKRREQEAKDRLAAAKNILDLENDLIANRFDQREAEAQTDANRNIAGLVGDPEQIERQAELIRESLRRELDGINDERRAAHTEALELVAQFGRELAEAQAENGALAEQAAFDQAERFFDTQEKALDSQLAQQTAKLTRALRSGELSYQEFAERRAALSLQDKDARVALATQRLSEESALDAQLTEKLLEQEQARFDIQQAAREREQLERDEGLVAKEEDGDLSPEELATGLAESEALRQEQERAALIEHEEAKAEISAGFIERGLDRVEAASEEERAIQRRSLKAIEKLEKDKQKIILDSTQEIGESIGKFLTSQEKDMQGFLKEILTLALDALEKLILLSISSSTVQSLAQPDSVATFGASGLARAAILGGLIKGAFAGIKAIVSDFEGGGVLPGSQGQWEGGNVPVNSGTITGRRHAAGGIRRGNVEVESGEYKLRNGRESYIVNRRSTRMFKPWLDRLASDPGIYSPERRQMASAINAYSGFGVRFEEGGVLSGDPLAAPLNADGLVPFASNSGAETAAMRELSERGMMLSEAAILLAEETNARIDRLEVVINPGKAVNAGNNQLEAEAKRGL